MVAIFSSNHSGFSRRSVRPASTQVSSTVRLALLLRLLPGKQAPNRSNGFSLLEMLLAICIVLAALAILASQLGTQAGNPRKAAALNAIAAAASSDLAWLNSYSQYWLLESGPLNVPTTTATLNGVTINATTRTTSFSQSSYLSYQADSPDASQPTLNLCGSDAFTTAFLVAAQTVNALKVLPAQGSLYPTSSVATIPTNGSATTLSLPADAGTSVLKRTITSTGQIDHVNVSYSLTSDPYGLGFRRSTAILIAAAPWCSS